MHPSPLKHYQQLVDRGDCSADPDQLRAVTALNELWEELQRQRHPGILHRLRRKHTDYVKGIYLWGGVGRGKTWLMDIFYQYLPAQRKQRIHFHRFMQRVHNDLRARKNVQDPLSLIASDWARTCSLLCLDEFFVSDIADAMLLASLLEGLFRNGVTLVTTSNIEPDGLYRDGLQRAKFLPAIQLLKDHTQVIELTGDIDYRLRILEQSEIYHHPDDSTADRVLTESFNRMAAECEMNHDLDVNGRSFHARRRGDGVIWFDFSELCEKPRGSIDYIELARAFNTVFLSGAPQLGEDQADEARRFITLVDEFYDRNVKLLMSAAVPLNELYTGRKLAFEFKRTASRLTEMQSHDYLARPHLP
jgi:cell division protein ZapE